MTHTEIRFDKVVRWLLPAFLRKDKRLRWLNAWVYPLTQVFERFKDYRMEAEYKANMTGQTLLLTDYLNKLLDKDQRRIAIKHKQEIALYLPLSTEGYPGVKFSTQMENKPVKMAATLDKVQQLSEDFAVYLPEEVNETALTTLINRYKIAGKTFKLIKA